MDKIEIKIDDKKVKKLLKRLLKKTQDTKPLMGKISGIMLNAVEENFEQEGRPKWKKLADSTIKQREREGKWPGKILQRSGSLASNIHEYHNKTSAVVGTNKKYAPIHQFGFKGEVKIPKHTRKIKKAFGKKLKKTKEIEIGEHTRKLKIPARPFLNLTDEDLEDIREVIKEYLTENI